jgi:hypothetical protein
MLYGGFLQSRLEFRDARVDALVVPGIMDE